MASRWPIIKHLKRVDRFLGQFHHSQQPANFEKLIAEAFSSILYLPFYTADNDDANVQYRVTWHGSESGGQLSKAAGSEPDAIAFSYDFHLVLEGTMSVGANQWAHEFAPCSRHCEEFAQENGVAPEEVYVVLVAPTLYRDTYQSLHNHPRQDYLFVPMEVATVTKILEIYTLAFTAKHVELRRLLNQTVDCFKTASSLSAFRTCMVELLSKWQVEVLANERNAVIGVKSYEAMIKINRKHIGTGEIFNRLQNNPTVARYLELIRDSISIQIVEESLIQQSLAYELSQTYDRERVFSPVPFVDFKKRGDRLMEAVQKIRP